MATIITWFEINVIKPYNIILEGDRSTDYENYSENLSVFVWINLSYSANESKINEYGETEYEWVEVKNCFNSEEDAFAKLKELIELNVIPIDQTYTIVKKIEVKK